MSRRKASIRRNSDDAKSRGVYSHYLDRRLSGDGLTRERQKQLKRISKIRKRPTLVMAAAITKSGSVSTSIDYDDILPFQDLLEGLSGNAIDVVVETPGGSAEVVEDLVTILRQRFEKVAFIVPGWAKSAGTIFVMAGNEILMGPASALGPIDAQLMWKNKQFSADAFLKGLREMKKEAQDPDKGLNRAHIPILQQISPGEIQHAVNALRFAEDLVAGWLEQHKFEDWTVHRSSGAKVTLEERRRTARKVAKQLCNHEEWLTHGRSIGIKDLEQLGLRITDFSTIADLDDAIRRYRALLQMSFESNMYKLFETQYRMIARFVNVDLPAQERLRKEVAQVGAVNVDADCPSCGRKIALKFRFVEGNGDVDGRIPYPSNDTVGCPHCGRQANLAGLRETVERQAGRKVITS